ncbi:MAG: dependent oxidoreductase [Candidatus Sulfotelmatobacter sp.]|nr:dependent oxidoreductase [Candidatus Sulfotelmatobacter sp.]
MPEFIETIIVGGGQAGLAISYYLKQEGREHLVLERAPAISNAWRIQRWDSFTLVTPNFQVRMPGAEYDGRQGVRNFPGPPIARPNGLGKPAALRERSPVN